MNDFILASLEILMLMLILTASFINGVTKSKFMLFFLFLIACAVGAMLGLPKSSYHALLIGLLLYVIRIDRWDVLSQDIIKAGMIFTLVCMSIMSLLHSDYQFGTKTAVLQLYTLWGVLIVINVRKKIYWLIPILIILDIFISWQVSARGILIGALASLLVLNKSVARKRRAIVGTLLSVFLVYTFAVPVFQLLGYQDLISGTASNYQRSYLNISALRDVLSTPLSMNEIAIYESASEYKYSYDSDELTVHNLILAFGLFNGLLPGLLLLYLLIKAIYQLVGSPFLPFGIYLFFLMMLGPDSSVTRIALIMMAGLIILDRGRHQYAKALGGNVSALRAYNASR